MNRLLLLIAVFLISHPVFGQGPRSNDAAAKPLTAAQIFEALDSRSFSSLEAVSLERLLKVLKKRRPSTGTRTGFRKTIKTRDGFGRRTNVLLDVPKSPKGIIFVLHGLGGDRFQLGRGVFDQFARKHGLILVAPDAQREPRKAGNEDLGRLGGVLQHWWSYRPQGFVMHLLQELRRTYNLDSGQVYLAGHSMGAFATWNIGLRYPDRFAGLVPISGGISRREYLTNRRDDFNRGLVYNASNSNILCVHGSNDRVVSVRHSRRTQKQMAELGYDLDYVELKGERHMLDLREKGQLAQGIGRWLLQKRRRAHPERIRHRMIGDYMMSVWWIRVDDARLPDAEIDARIEKDNRIVITTKKIDRLTVFLDEEHIDLKKPVEIVVNGTKRFAGRVTPTKAVLIESWMAREDSALLYRAKVEIDLRAKKSATGSESAPPKKRSRKF